MENDNKSYNERYAKLEGIEKATGVDMGFQKGMLDVEFSRTVFMQNPDEQGYSSYDAGVAYAMKKRNDFLQDLKNGSVDKTLNVSKIL